MLAIRNGLTAALRYYPFLSGYDRIALSKPLAAFARNEEFAVVTLRNGAKMLVIAPIDGSKLAPVLQKAAEQKVINLELI